PPDIRTLILAIFNIPVYMKYFPRLFMHAGGRMADDEKTFIPEFAFPKIYRNARIYLAIYAASVGMALYTHSILPLLFVGLANIFGSWIMVLYGLTQHAGLAENVLDHRLNCRTVYMNPIHRYLYWNMNYHVEHHMFPLVPYHALPRLHEAVKDDCPEPYPNLIVAYREIIPAILRQVKDPAWHVKRKLPASKRQHVDETYRSGAEPDPEGWMEICAAADLGHEDVIRFDHGVKTYALYRDGEDNLHATDGFCTHGNTHLADGLVKGKIIECPKHNGRFNLEDGSPARPPVCRGLITYPIEERNGRIWLNITKAGGAGAREEKTYRFKVCSNNSISTFIKELVLEPMDASEKVSFRPGDYMQLDIPAYEQIRFRDFDIPEPYASVWERQHVFDLIANNPSGGRRNNYSIASNCQTENTLRFNVRIATPPPGQDCPPGVGSSYVFNLKPGDTVTGIGPFGDFHIRPSQREMVYIGGGAGMAPLRAHLAQLFENDHTPRKVSFWYGARSRQEIYYQDYFDSMAADHSNFAFHLALSSPLPEDNWDGPTGFIHEVVMENYLKDHPNPQSVEFYLCGPPMMIKACNKMLAEIGVAPHQISFDEF
ncbi:MAG TPA: NADH:ubiquinone reductase (Na(+)-transporting) subunit F, partial [Oceanipulchritudo sp.]|nr:NADH:ubiquinone reductase (Na(+)-transporting) subunit F [Oceanipulchritudo sp.]